MTLDHVSERLREVADWFAHLSPETLARIDRIYAADARFRDPFNDVSTITAIQSIYAHMFEHLTNPRFVITHAIEQESSAFLAWRFLFSWRGKSFDIEGGTRLAFGEDGLIDVHQDYWDVAHGLYEKLPLVGGLMAWLRRRMSATG